MIGPVLGILAIRYFQIYLFLLEYSIVDYRRIVAEISEWCEKNDLELDITKTKELIIDNSHHASPINGADVDIVDAFTF